MEYCVCGHQELSHALNIINPSNVQMWCRGCWFDNADGGVSNYHDFKLDNLKLIEDLAKEKGLI